MSGLIEAQPCHFLLLSPKKDEIHAMVARFWWGSNDSSRKIHWLEWHRLCKPKKDGGMGFRNLKCFNEALLAKQRWRLIMNQDSLAAKVLKSRYYKKEDFIDARRGYDPSFTWRSIWGAKHLLLEGLKWRVGNGRTINAWKHNWLLEGGANNLLERPRNANEDMLVAEFISDEGGWNHELLSTLFVEQVVEKILQVPPSQNCKEDSIYWSKSRDGQFTVRTAYWMGMQGASAGGAQVGGNEKWQKIWSMVIPNKLKHFLWKAARSILATKKSLFDRHITDSDVCGICNQAPESQSHMIFSCTYSRELWTHAEWSFLAGLETEWTEVFDWVCAHKKEALIPLLVRAWSAWTIRNKVIFENAAPRTQTVLAGLERYVTDFQATNAGGSQARAISTTPSHTSWHKPSRGWVKINVDAAILGGTKVGLGAVIRNSEGELKKAAVQRIDARWDPETAEFAAAAFGVELAKSGGWHRVILESDSLCLIKHLQAKKKIQAPRGVFLEDVFSLMPSFTAFTVSHVRRGGSALAHFVAHFDPPDGVCFFFDGDVPPTLKTLVELDLI